MAKQRTRQLVKRLFKTPDLLKTYHQILSEQETRGFIQHIDNQSTIHSGIHSIPHHAVEKDSATTPIRLQLLAILYSLLPPHHVTTTYVLCSFTLGPTTLEYPRISRRPFYTLDYILMIGTTHAFSGYPTWQTLQVSFALIISRLCPSEPLVHHLC